MLSKVSVYLLRSAIRAYRIAVAPIFPTTCRHFPSCSHYAEDAIERHGARSGAWMAFKRVLRCHPFSAGGMDPVPGRQE